MNQRVNFFLFRTRGIILASSLLSLSAFVSDILEHSLKIQARREFCDSARLGIRARIRAHAVKEEN